jgi:phosphoribosylformylglycinamidine cyclo-ligase
VTGNAYARAGVDTGRAGSGVEALVSVLATIDSGEPSRVVIPAGHYASVLRLDDQLGLAVATDGVGSKVIVAERLGRFQTIGVDCVAMNVNDLVCVGARPLALVDYVAVERSEAEMLRDVALGLKVGAELAGIEIPGGELAELPEVIRGHPSPRGFDLVGTCFGTVALDRIVTGSGARPGDAIVGIPSTGVHSNGLTLARSALPDLEERPGVLGGASVGDVLLEATAVYVRAVLELLDSGCHVRGLAHITGDGLLNLLRLDAPVGFEVDAPLPVPAIFELVAERGGVAPAELYEVFNMGCGFCCVVPPGDADATVSLLGTRHPGAARIGRVTDEEGVVRLPGQGLAGRRGGGFAPV